MTERTPAFFERLALRLELLIMTRLVPADNPGPVFKRLFKVPVFFYKIGLPLFGSFILLLTTTGRKSGKPHYTPLEYRREAGTGHCILTAGWGGNSDWCRNILARPRVRVQHGRVHFDALAEQLSDEAVADWLALSLRINPPSERIWSRWAGEHVCLQDREGLLRAAKKFPSFRLIPVISEGEYHEPE